MALATTFSVSAAKPTTMRGRPAVIRATVRRMSGFSTSARDGASPLGGFLIFWSRDPSIRQSATAAANDRDVGRQRRLDRREHLARRLDADQLDAGGRRQI